MILISISLFRSTLLSFTSAGITMTEKSLQKSFSQHGVIKFGAVGDVFDPSLHDALFSVPDATKKSGITSILVFLFISFSYSFTSIINWHSWCGV
jgi:GrpE